MLHFSPLRIRPHSVRISVQAEERLQIVVYADGIVLGRCAIQVADGGNCIIPTRDGSISGEIFKTETDAHESPTASRTMNGKLGSIHHPKSGVGIPDIIHFGETGTA